jgi:hypothetical protein
MNSYLPGAAAAICGREDDREPEREGIRQVLIDCEAA